jgi:hypothetical protein
MVRQNIVVWEHLAEEALHLVASKKQRERKGPGAWYNL